MTTLPKGTRVEVYRNLNTGLISVRDYKTKKVYTDISCHSIVLENCKATVQPAGFAHVFNGGQKRVHAWISGNVVAINRNLDHNAIEGKRINYNPRIRGEFYDIDTNEAWHGGQRIAMMVTDFGIATIEA